MIGSGATQAIYRTNQSTNSYDWVNGAPIATAITAYAANGITLGTNATVNTASTVYHYVNWNESAGYLDLGTYTGNSVDSRNITGVGLAPEFISIRAVSGSVFAASKSESSGYATDSTDYGLSNQIQSLGADGFQIGSDSMVNTNGTAYVYFAFGQNSAPLFVDTTSDTSDGTTTSITALRANRGVDGVISLREAIAAANAAHNGTVIDEINFAISGSGVQTITIGTTGLANITDAVKIDAWTQSGYSSTPVIELNGGNSGTTKDGFNLASGSSGSTIRGFIINRFTGDGIEINSSNNHVIEGNWIGLNNTGSAASANALRGIYAVNSTGLTIGGTTAASRNVISGNTQQGIYFNNVDNSFIYGNYIGTDTTGLLAVGNTLDGVLVDNGSSNTYVGGSTTATRNIIAGNGQDGVQIDGEASDGNFIQNNYIGLGSDGLTVLGNGADGISITGGADNTTIGGVNIGNVIMGSGLRGILVDGASTGTLIYGNSIGMNLAGTVVTGQQHNGILIQNGASSTTIGGTTAGQANTITDSGLEHLYPRSLDCRQCWEQQLHHCQLDLWKCRTRHRFGCRRHICQR